MTGDSSTSLLFFFFSVKFKQRGENIWWPGCSSGEGSGPQKTLLCVQICIVVNQLEPNIYKHHRLTIGSNKGARQGRPGWPSHVPGSAGGGQLPSQATRPYLLHLALCAPLG